MSQPETPEDAVSSSPTPDAATTQHIPTPAYMPDRVEPAAHRPAEQPATPDPLTSLGQRAAPDPSTTPGLTPTAAYPTVAPLATGGVPTGYAPVSAQGTTLPGAPVSTQGTTPAGAPVSGPGGSPEHGYPTPPGFAAPPAYPAAAIASPPRRGKALLVTMSCLTAVLLLATAAMTYAFIDRNNAYHKQVRIVTQRDSTISNDSGQINTLKSQLAAARAQNSQLQQQATGSGNQVSELKSEKAALSKCINAVDAFFNAAGSNASDATLNKFGDKMESACVAAEKYMD